MNIHGVFVTYTICQFFYLILSKKKHLKIINHNIRYGIEPSTKALDEASIHWFFKYFTQKTCLQFWS